MSNVKLFVPAVAFLAAFATVGSAVAGPISQWSFTVNQSFDPRGTEWGGGWALPSYGSGQRLPDDGWRNTGQYSWMKWGSSLIGEQSFLAADTNVRGTVSTGGPAVAGASFYHGNYELSGLFAAPEQMSLLSSIQISAVGRPDLSFTLADTFVIDFAETANAGQLANCSGSGSAWTSGSKACPDRLSLNTAPMTFTTDEIDGYIYDFTVSFDLANSENILGLSFAGPLATLWTAEDVRSRLGTLVQVSARAVNGALPVSAVPEPGSIALLGGGLAGVGLGLRRRRRA